MLFKERFHFVDIEVGEDELSVSERRSAALTGESLHFSVLSPISDDIDALVAEALSFEIGDGIDTPGASGFQIDFKGGHIVSG